MKMIGLVRVARYFSPFGKSGPKLLSFCSEDKITQNEVQVGGVAGLHRCGNHMQSELDESPKIFSGR